MAQRLKVLIVTGEVAPFTKADSSAIGPLARHLSENLHTSGEYETRIMMPRYGLISERRNRLHEVIRLCGTPIQMGARRETLKVKVAPIPGIRLQVYFMDNTRFFKRKGLHRDKEGTLYKDNHHRSMFFCQSVLETIQRLRWKPDVVHAFGWISSLLPVLLSTSKYRKESENALFSDTRVVYTPDGLDANANLTRSLANQLEELQIINGLASVEIDDFVGHPISEIGLQFSDANAFPATVTAVDGALQFSNDAEEVAAQTMDLYGSTLDKVAA